MYKVIRSNLFFCEILLILDIVEIFASQLISTMLRLYITRYDNAQNITGIY